MAEDTCLSPKVRHIICEICDESDVVCEDAINDSGLLQWDIITRIMPTPVAPSCEDMDYFVSCVRALSPVMRAVHQYYTRAGEDSINKQLNQYMSWTSEPQVLCRCYQLTREDTRVGSIHSLLMSTSILEHSLGDLFLLRGSVCPSMLKDLLITKQLTHLLGNTTLFVLRVLIGPPISLNLRNVLWHGFPSPGEIHPQFVYMLLSVMVSIGEILDNIGISVMDIPHRPWVTFPHISSMERKLLSDVHISSGYLEYLKEQIKSSLFVQPSMIDLWKRGLDMYQTGRYGECVCLLLPLLEHGLRREFAKANNCTERMLTAESSVLFTTLDEILSAYVEDERENKLRYFLGDQLMMILLDLLSYPAGPRLRDRVSHGETSITEITESVTSVVLAVCAICICLDPMQKHPLESSGCSATLVTECDRRDHSKLEDSSRETGNVSVDSVSESICSINLVDRLPIVAQLTTALDSYRSQYHPVSTVQSQILMCAKSLDQWSAMSRPEQGDVGSCVDWTSVRGGGVYDTSITAGQAWLTAYQHNLNISLCVLEPFGPLIESYVKCLSLPISTIYRTAWDKQKSREEEIVGLLQQITHECHQVADQVLRVVGTRYDQFNRKELRSRQRKTYARMLDSIPLLSTGLRLVVMVCSVILYSLDDIKTRQLPEQLKLVKLLKSILQYTELLMTYSGTDRNKWDEATLITTQIIHTIEHHAICR